MEDLKKLYKFFNKWSKEIIFGLLFIVFMQTCSNSCSVNSGFDETKNSIVSVKKDLDTLKNKNNVLILELNSIKESNLTEQEFKSLNEKFVKELLKFEKAIDDKEITLSEVEIKIDEK